MAQIEKIEILGLDIFDTHKEEMEVVERIRAGLDMQLGWHYYLDLAWMIREINMLPKGSLILDAGAGVGLSQFILAEFGYNVISADFASRVFTSSQFERYGNVIYRINDESMVFDNRYMRFLEKEYGTPVGKLSNLMDKLKHLFVSEPDDIRLIEINRLRLAGSCRDVFDKDVEKECGRIFLYKCDLKDMPLLPDGFVDAVVSVSALEHNDHADFEKCVDEILRVTKHSGRIAVTVSASQSEDWFHEPSKGWCYSEATIKRIFRLSEGVKSNFSQKDEFFGELRKEGNELHKRLAPVYFKSGDNGMPWGKWDPKYQPVGVIKVKD